MGLYEVASHVFVWVYSSTTVFPIRSNKTSHVALNVEHFFEAAMTFKNPS